jgi:UvrB/UvrC motif-containing protein
VPVKSKPVQPEATLEEQLAVAVAREDYDEAARLRDLIARTWRPPQPGPEYTWVNRGSGGYWRRGKRTGE